MGILLCAIVLLQCQMHTFILCCICHLINLFFSPTAHMDEEEGLFRRELQDSLFYYKHHLIYLHNFLTADADYNACHPQTSFKLYKWLWQCQLKTYSPHFSLVHLCVFYDCHHSSTARQGVLIESLMRYYLFIFHKHLPLHSSFPSNSVLWGSSFGTVKVLASFHRKLGKWGAGMRSGCYLTSHGALHGMLVLSEWRRQRHTQCYHFQFCRGSCLWVLVTHVLAHALLPWTFWSFLTGSWAFLHRKTFHMSWLEQNNVYALHSKTTWSIYAHTSPTDRQNTHLLCSGLCYSFVQWEANLHCNSSTCWYINPMTSTQ